ncbi:hypothetical protein LTR85_007436 [Meristemomyces frigidus]|nr:hypothetical protein LTR85_007436 [Meristemomyces frigidus]
MNRIPEDDVSAEYHMDPQHREVVLAALSGMRDLRALELPHQFMTNEAARDITTLELPCLANLTFCRSETKMVGSHEDPLHLHFSCRLRLPKCHRREPSATADRKLSATTGSFLRWTNNFLEVKNMCHSCWDGFSTI